jgi:heme exporter protein D
MNLGPHAGFIITGYLLSVIVIVGMILLSVNAMRRTRARIAELEARGIRRRSDQRPATTPVGRETKA